MKKDPIVLPADPTDPEDFAVSTSGMARGLEARAVRQSRTRLGLTQGEFARRFHVPVGTLRDWEQARTTPPDFALAYLKLVERYPDLVAEAIG